LWEESRDVLLALCFLIICYWPILNVTWNCQVIRWRLQCVCCRFPPIQKLRRVQVRLCGSLLLSSAVEIRKYLMRVLSYEEEESHQRK
jgi:hypothetical protein